jgi:threonine dehydrogenase-like Zn-dependent dehydrogenase
MFNHLLLTADRFEKDVVESGIIVAKKGDLKLWQTVVAIGSTVRDIKVGDQVMIIPDHFAVKKYNKNSVQNDLDNNPVLSYRFPFETMEDEKGETKDYLYISDNSVRYVFKGEEKDDALILPAKKKVLLM